MIEWEIGEKDLSEVLSLCNLEDFDFFHFEMMRPVKTILLSGVVRIKGVKRSVIVGV
jgi:hypothetical protein